MTIAELAKLLNITDRTIYMWEQKNAEFRDALAKSRSDYQSDPNYFDKIARHIAMESLIKGAMQNATNRDEMNDKRVCIKELLKQTEYVAENKDHIDMSHYSDKELLEMCVKGNLDINEYSKEELESILKDFDKEEL
jgi:hypothetical protein